jgi:hypothetical protein
MVNPETETTSGAAGAAAQHALVGLSPTDLARLREAHHLLEHPSLAARLSSVVGTPIEVGLRLLPRPWYGRLQQTSETAIGKAYGVAISSFRLPATQDPHRGLYQGLSAGTGALGGLFGLPGLIVELPITTTLMLRSIAEIARAHGEDIHEPETRLACLQVFALGAHSESDDAAETGYYGVRLALSAYVSASVRQVAQQGLAGEGAPTLVQLIRVIAARFGTEVSRRAATQLLPVVGAVGGAAVNTIFMQHFQDMARGHFTVRQLERRYGESLIRNNYAMLDEVD